MVCNAEQDHRILVVGEVEFEVRRGKCEESTFSFSNMGMA